MKVKSIISGKLLEPVTDVGLHAFLHLRHLLSLEACHSVFHRRGLYGPGSSTLPVFFGLPTPESLTPYWTAQRPEACLKGVGMLEEYQSLQCFLQWAR